jgi:hypothetical protein
MFRHPGEPYSFVIPAKAGIQSFRHSGESRGPGFKWFARFARDLKC